MNFTTAAALLALCQSQHLTLAQAMLLREEELFGSTRQEVEARLLHSLGIMRTAAATALAAPQKTMGGLIGGEAIRISTRSREHRPVCGGLMSRAVAIAMGTLEVNASMGLIVAAPTAGSCGVLPGAILALDEEFSFGDEALVEALLTSSAVGYLVARNATIAGAQGGCQAEVGAASAMAAAAAVQLRGGSPTQCLSAAGTAIVNILGLVCDPIGGLVESPCQSRNAMGVSNALVSAELALSGVGAPVPFDEVVEAMYAVGRALPSELRETALGGIAIAPSACRSCPACAK